MLPRRARRLYSAIRGRGRKLRRWPKNVARRTATRSRATSTVPIPLAGWCRNCQAFRPHRHSRCQPRRWPVEDVAIEKMAEEQWRSTLSINLDAVFGLVKHTVAQMKAQPRNGSPAGHIVLISSTSGQRGEAFHCDYSASKGAIISMTKSLSTELASAGIYVNSVAPGWVDTDMSKPALDDPRSGENIRRTIPLGRAGTPRRLPLRCCFYAPRMRASSPARFST